MSTAELRQKLSRNKAQLSYRKARDMDVVPGFFLSVQMGINYVYLIVERKQIIQETMGKSSIVVGIIQHFYRDRAEL